MHKHKNHNPARGSAVSLDKSTKNPNPSRKRKTSEKNSVPKTSWIEDYLDGYSFRMKPVNERFLRDLAKELVDWAEKDDDALTLEEFYTRKRIPSRTFEGWYRFDWFKQAKDLALSFIGIRREKATLKRKLDAGTNNYMMPYYSSEWKKIVEWRQQLRNESQNNGTGSVNVYLEKFESSDLVPERKATSSLTPEEVAARATKHTRLGHGIDN